MAIFTMSDLHLALSVEKPMNVFGSSWENYMQRILEQWNAEVSKEDTVIVGGDVSWAMYLGDIFEDFKFIHALNGDKILLKGNHDYWWESLSKMKNYVLENGFTTIKFLHNNAYLADNCLICGSRGWISPGDSAFSKDDEKIYKREVQRLKLSLEDGQRLISESGLVPEMRVCALHYPPFTKAGDFDENIISLLKEYRVTHCIYGHLHAGSRKKAIEGEYYGIEFKLVSADHLEFKPYRI